MNKWKQIEYRFCEIVTNALAFAKCSTLCMLKAVTTAIWWDALIYCMIASFCWLNMWERERAGAGAHIPSRQNLFIKIRNFHQSITAQRHWVIDEFYHCQLNVAVWQNNFFSLIFRFPAILVSVHAMLRHCSIQSFRSIIFLCFFLSFSFSNSKSLAPSHSMSFIFLSLLLSTRKSLNPITIFECYIKESLNDRCLCESSAQQHNKISIYYD